MRTRRPFYTETPEGRRAWRRAWEQNAAEVERLRHTHTPPPDLFSTTNQKHPGSRSRVV